MKKHSYIYRQNWLVPIDELQPGSLVVLYARVSDPHQEENLPAQKKALEIEAQFREFRVIRKVSEICSGKKARRRGLQAALQTATRSGAAVVARDLNRLRRSRSTEHDARLTPDEMESLRLEAAGVQLATVIHPDATEAEVRSYQIKTGQAATQRGGRPAVKFPKKARRQRLEPKVRELLRQGASVCRIARELNCARSTVGDWVSRIKNQPSKFSLRS